MIYDIQLRMAHEYDNPAIAGRHIVCVMPLDTDPGQHLVTGTLGIEPPPNDRIDRRDFFGNQVTEFSFRAPHDSVVISLRARVARNGSYAWPASTLMLDDMPAALARWRDLGPKSPLHFLAPSFRVPIRQEMTAFARRVVKPDMTVAALVGILGGALHDHMQFDTRATEVDTTASEAFEKRKGVCQDYAHIMIAGLRGLGVPAGYVSGFLRTRPPPGKPRLEGADAMHAWVQAWCGPDVGWLEFDPTNDTPVGANHVVVARGRDYADVAPVKGSMRISGRQKSDHAVDVVPVPEQP